MYSYKIEAKKDLKNFRKELVLIEHKLAEFNSLINLNNIFNSYYVVYKNKKSIAFSLVIYQRIKKQEVFVYFTALPTEEGSDIIISCKDSDYELIKLDAYMLKIFEGDKIAINKLLNIFKEKVAHNIEEYEINFADRFFLEWDQNLFPIEYYEPL